MPRTDIINKFDCRAFIARHGGGTISRYPKKLTIYSEGDQADALLYVMSGTAEIVVNSRIGKEALIAILGPGDFFGEGCLNVDPLRTSTIITTSDCNIAQFTKSAVRRALNNDPIFSELLMGFILRRNEELKAELTDHLFNSSEKRLARILLTLAGTEDEIASHLISVPMNQEILAKMVGTTRSRINLFMNKFRKLGYIDYNGKIEVHRSLINIILSQTDRGDGR